MKDSSVVGIAAVISVVAVFLLTATMWVLFEAGYWWLASSIFAPLAYGLARWPIWVCGVFRPTWFKPGWLKEHGFRKA